MNIETICNEALDAVGYLRHIGNIYEGTPAANIALNAWDTLRDGLLQQLEPDWARKDSTLVLLKSAPNITGGFANYDDGWDDRYPPLPWLYEYTAPDDMITPLLVKPMPFVVPVLRPRPVQYLLRTEGTVNTILANISDPVLLYIFRLLDPAMWPQDFVAAMISGLAKQFAAQLGKAPPPARREVQNEAAG